MKKTKGFVMRRIGEEAMIIAESMDLIDFDRIVALNSSAAYIWESLPDTDFTVESVADLLTENYDVKRVAAYRDGEELINIWIKAGIIEE